MSEKEELIKADIEEMKDWEKSILIYIANNPKPKVEEIEDGFKNLIDSEDISDFLNCALQEGILYKNYANYHLTTYGDDLIKKLKQEK